MARAIKGAEHAQQNIENCDLAKSLMKQSLNPDSPKAARQALDQLLCARRESNLGKFEAAFKHYKQAMLLLFEAEKQNPGHWSKALRETNREYAKRLLGA